MELLAHRDHFFIHWSQYLKLGILKKVINHCTDTDKKLQFFLLYIEINGVQQPNKISAKCYI